METTQQSAVQLPRWQCHKEVYADKIVAIREGPEWLLEGGGVVPSGTVPVLIQRKAPVVGDYYVVYDDGYQSWSPAKAFEEGYTRLT